MLGIAAVCLALEGGVDSAGAETSVAGSFTSTIALDVPAFHGIEPSVSLSYDSTAPNGEVGVGWQLDVGSRITRRGAMGGLPRFDDAADEFVLDGTRLVACAPGCPTGGTHETRQRSFERIRFEGHHWTRWRRDGTRLYYAAPWEVPGREYQWPLAQETDTHGNAVDYDYDCSTGHCYPSQIRYAAGPTECGAPAQPPCRSGALIIFHWEARPDIRSYATGDATQQIRRRLRTVEVRMDGQLVRAYALAYLPSTSTGMSVLRSVRQFPADALIAPDGSISAGPTPPRPAIELSTTSMTGSSGAWDAGHEPAQLSISAPPGTATLGSVSLSVPGDSLTITPGGDELVHSPAFGDFDGDGRVDMASWRCSGGTSKLYSQLAGQPSPTPHQTSLAVCLKTTLVADVDADRFDDLLVLGSQGGLRSATSNRDGTFTLHPPGPHMPWAGFERRCTSGDLDGDERTDVACVYNPFGPLRLGVARAQPDGSFDISDNALPPGVRSVRDVVAATGDVDASGTDDVLLAVAPPFQLFQLFTGLAAADGSVASWSATPTPWSAGDASDATLSGADITGDARADLTLIAADTEARVATSDKTAAGGVSLRVQTDVVASGGNLAVGDGDGDGRADLFSGSPPRLMRSGGDGSFAAGVPLDGPDCSISDQAQALAGDINADGQADLMCATPRATPEGFDLAVQRTPVAPPRAHRWMPADLTGNGRQGLLNVHFRNPGYEIYAMRRTPDGKYASSDLPVVPTATAPLTSPNAGGFVPMDVGSPSGPADGRTDLVLVERRDGTLHVTTLLSTAGGWVPVDDTPWKSGGTVTPFAPKDVAAWQPADIDRDGKSDLVHFQPLGAGVRVQFLRAEGNGRWTSGSSVHFDAAAAAGGALTRPDVSSFRVADLDSDGMADFVHVEVGGTATAPYYTIRSLISTGPATWRDESWQRLQPLDRRAAHALQIADLNGDGLSDLADVDTVAGCPQITVLVRSGDAAWSVPRTLQAAAPCRPTVAVDDRNRYGFADVNHDGRADLYHLSGYRDGAGTLQTAMVTFVNPPGDLGTPWRTVDQPGLPDTGADAWAWISFDADHDGDADLGHAGAGLATLRWTAPADRLTGTDNHRGAVTSVRYRPQAGARSYLPPATLPIVTAAVVARDVAGDTHTTETTRWSYGGARWSNTQRQLLGYARVRSRQGRSVIVARNDLDSACGTRPVSTAVRDRSGGLFTRWRLTFVPPGAEAPYTCLPATRVEADCELATHCRKTRTSFDYDAFGNATVIEESRGGAKRRTLAPVHPNTDAYIVDRPYKSELQSWHGEWRPRSRTLYGYDGDSFEHPPGDHGDLTRVTAFSDITHDEASETFNLYDEAGNRTWTMNPVGMVTSINYDPVRKLFPLSVCGPVGCTATTWDERLGVQDTVTDPNRQTTLTTHDAFGRTTFERKPDGQTTTTQYLATPGVAGVAPRRERMRIEVSDGSPGDGVHWHEEHLDGLGRVYRTQDEGTTAAPAAVIVRETRYARASIRRRAVSTPHLAGATPNFTRFRYDPRGRLTRTIRPDGTATTRSYGIGVVRERDEAGRSIGATHRDAFGRIDFVDEPAPDCGDCSSEVQRTRYRYDAADRLTAIVNSAGQRTSIQRDALGREVRIHDPDRGRRRISYRPDGSVKTEQSENGTRTITYDAAGRPQSLSAVNSNGAQKAHWDYDRDPATGMTQGSSVGRPTRVTYSTSAGNASVSGRYRFWYDQVGRTTVAEHCIDAVCQEIGSTYDSAGRISDLRYPKPGDPDGEHVRYAYDAAGRLTSVGGFLTGIEHNALGQTTAQTYGNGLSEAFAYDHHRNWLDTQSLGRPPKPHTNVVYSASYTHDPTGRISALTTANPAGSRPPTVTRTFIYDNLGRLTASNASDRPSLLPERYDYDAIGRITRSPTAGDYRYDDPAHVHAVTSTGAGHKRAYNRAGNLLHLVDPDGRDLLISWSPDGMPITLTDQSTGVTTSMGYDQDGQRVKKTDGHDVTYYFDRYTSRTGNGGLTKYYWAGDQLIATRAPDGSVSYFLQDHSHSTRVATDEQAGIRARYDYEPYGQPHEQNQDDGTSQLWQGRRSDGESGLVYMGSRYYDPALGQFISPDSVIPAPYRPQSLNRYSFTEGDGGVNAWDPDGHMKMLVERKKEREAESSMSRMYAWSLSHFCGPLATCVVNAPGMTITERYSETDSGQFQKEVTYTGGLDAEGNWNFSTVTDTTIYHYPGDPNEWAPWPGSTTAPPLVSAPDPVAAGASVGDPAEWAPWPQAPSEPPLVSARVRRRPSTRGIGISTAPHSARLLDDELKLDQSLGSHVPTVPAELSEHHSQTGSDLGDVSVWLLTDSLPGVIHEAGFYAVANAGGLIGGVIADLAVTLTGARWYPGVEIGCITCRVQTEGFNPLWKRLGDHLRHESPWRLIIPVPPRPHQAEHH